MKLMKSSILFLNSNRCFNIWPNSVSSCGQLSKQCCICSRKLIWLAQYDVRGSRLCSRRRSRIGCQEWSVRRRSRRSGSPFWQVVRAFCRRREPSCRSPSWALYARARELIRLDRIRDTKKQRPGRLVAKSREILLEPTGTGSTHVYSQSLRISFYT